MASVNTSADASPTSNPFTSLIASHGSVAALLGAGISTSVGIPDFRSSSGLYSSLSSPSTLASLGLSDPTDLFSHDHFLHDPTGFYKWSPALNTGHLSPSPFHLYLASLPNLLRIYTQNIDGLELEAGSPPSKVVQCHGRKDTASCLRCGKHSEIPAFTGDVLRCKCYEDPGPAPSRSSSRRPSRPRSDTCGGVLRPDVTFFGLPLPRAFSMSLGKDRGKTDLVLVAGTSLKVKPFSSVPSVLGGRKVLLNREVVGELSDWDSVFLCDVDAVLDFEGFKEVKAGGPAVWVGPGGVWPMKDKGNEAKKREREEELEAERRMEIVCDGCGAKVGEGDAWYECDR